MVLILVAELVSATAVAELSSSSKKIRAEVPSSTFLQFRTSNWPPIFLLYPKLFLLLVTHSLPDVLSEHNASWEIHPRFRVFDASVITLGPDNDLGCQQ
jgi:hypothetical protein